MQIEGNPGSVQAQISTSIQAQAQDTSTQIVSKIMSGSTEGSAAATQARASQGVGTQLDVTG